MSQADGLRELLEAAKRGKLARVRRLLRAAAAADLDVNAADVFGWTALTVSAAAGHALVVRLLLEQGQTLVNKAAMGGLTALHLASQLGHVDVVRLLLASEGVDADKADAIGGTALHLASASGQVEVVQVLLASEGVDADKADAKGGTALHLASASGQVEVVQVLLACPRVDVNRAYVDGVSALHLAVEAGHVQVVRLLLAKAEVRVDARVAGGSTPLMSAAHGGRQEILQLLLARPGISINAEDDVGATALLFASSYGHPACVELLLGHEDIEATRCDHAGLTPLRVAHLYGHARVVRMLITHAARNAVRELADAAVESLPGMLLRKLPELAAQAAALCLPLYVAAALSESEEERATADELAFQSDALRMWIRQLRLLQVATPGANRAARAVARIAVPYSKSPVLQAREREADVVVAAAATTATLRAAQDHRAALFERALDRAINRLRERLPDEVDFKYALALLSQKLSKFKLQQAEVLARFAMHHSAASGGLQGARFALAAAIGAALARDEQAAARDEIALAAAVDELFADSARLAAMSIEHADELGGAVIERAAIAQADERAEEQGGRVGDAQADERASAAAASIERVVIQRASAAAASTERATIERAGPAPHCACPGCTNIAVYQCSACRAVHYCCQACQKRDWPSHKVACKSTSTASSNKA